MKNTSFYRVIPAGVGEAAIDSRNSAPHMQLYPRVGDLELEAAEQRVLSFRYSVIKRAIDVVGASLLLIAVTPALIAIAVAVKLTSRGPILYQEKRVGRFGLPFTILKFRTMYTKAHLAQILSIDLTTEQLASLRTHTKRSSDPRITQVGQFLRSWSLDELPQLLNVLRGDMSLVGPRPVVQTEREQFGAQGGFYDLALPGISGLWQVSGRSDLSFDRRVDLDSKYAREWGVLLDLEILSKTISAVLTRRGAY